MTKLFKLLAALALTTLVTAPAQAQIAFRAASSNTVGGVTPAFRAANSAVASGGNVTITKPTGTAANDVLIASIAVTPSTVTITAPSGWTLIRRTDNAATTSNSLAVYYRVTGGSEPTSYAFSVTGATFGVGGIQGFTGIDTTNPIEVENGQATPSATTHSTPSVTTSEANAMVVTSHSFASSNSWTPPSGMTESFDKPSGNNNVTGLSIEGNRVLQAVAGATGGKTATAAGNADAGNAHIVVLRPASVTLSISTPTGTAANDVLIAAIGFNNSTATVAPPAGWTLVRRMDNTSTTANSLAVYRRTAVSGEPASHAFLVAGGAFVVGGIQGFSGVDTSNPIDVENGQTTASGTAHATPSVTTTTANAMLVTAHTYASANSWTPAAGLTEAYDRPSGTTSTTGQAITGTWQLQATAGATGTKTSTAGGGADVGNTHILALRRLVPNTPPTVSITSPANNAVFAAPGSVTLTASASDSDGTVTKVEFFHGGTNLIGTVTTAPYSFAWIGVAPGVYSVTAVATDDRSGTTTSTAVNVIVDTVPSVSLTSPANGATFTAPASVTLTANASDTDGTIQKVEFFHGGTNLIATVTTAPYTANWTNVAQGTYAITAVATDDRGITMTSTAVNVTVNRATALYFIQVDQLNTPRLVADAAGTTVWKWDQQEAFGNNVPDENPSGLGAFDLPVRLPGQYFDKETNLHYNYFRDYDPEIGIFKQGDPIGLSGGLNLYVYASDPLTQIDPSGLMGSRGGTSGPNYSSCAYYDAVAANVGCKYHGFAGGACRGEHAGVNFMSTICMITTAQLNCIRRCLVEEDQKARGSKNCRVCTDKGNCTRLSCIDDYHKKCFTKCNVSSYCYGGRYWSGFPNDGDAPNEEKCCGR